MSGFNKKEILQAIYDNDITIREIANLIQGKVTATSEDEFIEGFYIDLNNTIKTLEDSKRFYHNDKEEKITNFLVKILKEKGYQISAETDVGGHVDIVLEFDIQGEEFKWLGEAKIANGPMYLNGGLTQLFKRYHNPKYKHCGLLIYVQNVDFKSSKSNWIDYIFDHAVFGLVDFDFLDNGFEFESKHEISTLGITTQLRHFWAYLHYNPPPTTKKKP